MPTYTTTYSLGKPVVGADEDAWGDTLNASLDSIDDILDGTTPVTGIDINSGTLDGVTIGGTTAGAGTFTNLTATGTTTLAGASTSADITFGDNDKAIFGAGSDLQIYHDGSGSFVDDQGTGGLILRGTNLFLRSSTNENYLGAVADGAVTIYHDNAQKLVTTSTGISVTGNATFADNGKAIFGAGSDLQIYHETSTGNSRIVESGSGHLNIEASNLNLKTPSGENYINCNDNGNVLLRYDNAQKLATTSTGVDITGTLTSDGLTVDGNGAFSGTDTYLAFIETDLTNESTRLRQTSGSLYIQKADNSGGFVQNMAQFDTNGDISFYEDTGTTAKFFWDASAESLGIGTSSPSNLLDIQSSTASGGMLELSNTGDTSRMLFISNSDGMIIRSNNSASGAVAKDTIFQQGTVEAMRIDSSGNVGIGTSSPATKLDVNGDGLAIRIDGTANTSRGIMLRNTGTAEGQIQTDGNMHFIQEDAGKYMRFSTANSERMRIDSSGNLLVGTTNSTPHNLTSGGGLSVRGSINLFSIARQDNEVMIVNRTGTDGDIALFRKNASTVGSIGSYVGAYVYVGSGDTGLVFAHGNDTIRPFDPSTGAERDNAIDMGSAGTRFDDIYATNGTIQTSDQNEKQDIAELSEAEQRVAVAAKGLLRKFRWKDAVAEKGDEARTHFGIIAQDLQAAFAAEGLDAGDYAMFIHSTWTDEETGEERSRMGVRYSELLAFIIAAI